MLATVRGISHCIGSVFKKNPNGSGTHYIEVRDFDMQGSIPSVAINKIKVTMPIRATEILLKGIAGAAEGKY